MSKQWREALDLLEKGEIRVAQCLENGDWQVNANIKALILEAFAQSENSELIGNFTGFVDKVDMQPRSFTLKNKVRIVPGGSAVRRGAYVAPGVIIMPPSYVNVGAYIDSGTMVDSHVLVGSCAQIGKNVHLSAGVQIGGVLEPVGNRPVIVEDDVFVGAGAIIVEGIIVRKKAVIAPRVILAKAIPVYDCVNELIITDNIIPEGAVVIPGTRPIKNGWGNAEALSIGCSLIIKYRDARTASSVILEQLLR